MAQRHLWKLPLLNCNSKETERRLKQKASTLVMRVENTRIRHVLSRLLGPVLPRQDGGVRPFLYSFSSLTVRIFSLSFGVLSKIGQVEL